MGNNFSKPRNNKIVRSRNKAFLRNIILVFCPTSTSGTDCPEGWYSVAGEENYTYVKSSVKDGHLLPLEQRIIFVLPKEVKNGAEPVSDEVYGNQLLQCEDGALTLISAYVRMGQLVPMINTIQLSEEDNWECRQVFFYEGMETEEIISANKVRFPYKGKPFSFPYREDPSGNKIALRAMMEPSMQLFNDYVVDPDFRNLSTVLIEIYGPQQSGVGRPVIELKGSKNDGWFTQTCEKLSSGGGTSRRSQAEKQNAIIQTPTSNKHFLSSTTTSQNIIKKDEGDDNSQTSTLEYLGVVAAGLLGAAGLLVVVNKCCLEEGEDAAPGDESIVDGVRKSIVG